MSEKNINLADAYYKAMNDKDIDAVAQYFHQKIHFSGPMGEAIGKNAVLESAKRMLSLFNTLTIRVKFGNDNQVMLAYDLDCPGPIGVLKVASLLTFKDNLIVNIELFYDTRPFDVR